jgi:hypothetical protein
MRRVLLAGALALDFSPDELLHEVTADVIAELLGR